MTSIVLQRLGDGRYQVKGTSFTVHDHYPGFGVRRWIVLDGAGRRVVSKHRLAEVRAWLASYLRTAS